MITYETIQELYRNNSNIFNQEANTIRSNNPRISDVQNLQHYVPSIKDTADTHITWRINRMTPGRIIRSLFPRPFIISEWSGQSIERYVMIDEINAQGYRLPNTDCSYVSVVQGSGERIIILRPSKECSNNCRTVSVVLKPSHVCKY